jgi:hypothetical protein
MDDNLTPRKRSREVSPVAYNCIRTWTDFDNCLRQRYSLVTTDCGGYPDCFFLCLKSFLKPWWTVKRIRKRLASYLVSHPPTGENILEHVMEEAKIAQPELFQKQKIDFDEYLNALRGTLFGGDVEIGAACACFKVSIQVISVGQNNGINFQQHGDMNSSNRWRLCFFGRHYKRVDDISYEKLFGDTVCSPGKLESSPVPSVSKVFSSLHVLNLFSRQRRQGAPRNLIR